MKWIRVITPQDNRIPVNTIGVVQKADSQYYWMKHWALRGQVFIVRKDDTEPFHPLTSVSYKGTTYYFIKYLQDWSAGLDTHNQMTGYRFEVKDSQDNHLILTLDDID